MNNTPKLSVEAHIHASLETVWERYTSPEYIVQWNFASPDWHCPHSENDPRTGGHFKSRMEAKDGSFGFDFEGTYDEVRPLEYMAYLLGDRKVEAFFSRVGDQTKVEVQFDPEMENSLDMQKNGWQAILTNFKVCAEA